MSHAQGPALRAPSIRGRAGHSRIDLLVDILRIQPREPRMTAAEGSCPPNKVS